MSEKVIRTERGWAGHFICADRCLFRRNTLLQCGKIFVVVSTVGVLPFPDRDGFDTIGLDRYYETMAFHSRKDDARYHDIDVARKVDFDSPWALEDKPTEENSDNNANDMHEAVVKEITEKLLAGEMKGA